MARLRPGSQEVGGAQPRSLPLRAFIEIILPQVMPGVIAGGLFALIVSFDDIGISIFLDRCELAPTFAGRALCGFCGL